MLKQSVRVGWGGAIVADGYFSYWYVLTASFTGGESSIFVGIAACCEEGCAS